MEGESAITKGWEGCHDVGKPDGYGSIGDCTQCHSRHNTSIIYAREPETCGQCHMGPDHAQLEIYKESKDGIIYNAERMNMNLDADPQTLTIEDMFAPTCVTCHMSGLGGSGVTHKVSDRLFYYLFAAVSEKRSNYLENQTEMKAVCFNCHAKVQVDTFYTQAEAVLVSTNEKVNTVEKIMASLREDGLLIKEPYGEPVEFTYFDYWHYYSRTAKHGAFMGGADFVQWHPWLMPGSGYCFC